MSETTTSANSSSKSDGEARFTALFFQMIARQANMAAMLMGKVAHPETGETIKDIDAARLFIDELEMIEARTRGNLGKEEAAFLKQTLMNLRLSFVEAVDSPEPAETAKPSAEPSQPAEPGQAAPAAETAAPAKDERQPKFSKKY